MLQGISEVKEPIWLKICQLTNAGARSLSATGRLHTARLCGLSQAYGLLWLVAEDVLYPFFVTGV